MCFIRDVTGCYIAGKEKFFALNPFSKVKCKIFLVLGVQTLSKLCKGSIPETFI